MLILNDNLKSIVKMLSYDIEGNINKNILIIGKSGYGKTSLARYISDLTNKSYILQYGFKYNLNNNYPINIIDEVHTVKEYEEFYRIMDLNLDGTGNKTLIFTTTHIGNLPEPFINRCFIIDLGEYTKDELFKIAKYYGYSYSDKILNEIVNRSRNTPRIIVELILKLDMYKRYNTINEDNIDSTLDLFGVYKNGLTDIDKKYLNILQQFKSMSLNNMVKALSVPKTTVENYIEPYLIKMGLIKITTKGRVLNEN